MAIRQIRAQSIRPAACAKPPAEAYERRLLPLTCILNAGRLSQGIGCPGFRYGFDRHFIEILRTGMPTFRNSSAVDSRGSTLFCGSAGFSGCGSEAGVEGAASAAGSLSFW